MHLKILLPFQIFLEQADVGRIVAETREGFFGVLPHRRDCVAALVPGIFSYAVAAGSEMYVAIDEGVLVKFGSEVLVSVRRAIGGADLGQLRGFVEKDFLTMDAEEKSARTAIIKLENGFLSRLAAIRHE
jgi:F-type H+-transporting ATPase subunit epsilon